MPQGLGQMESGSKTRLTRQEVIAQLRRLRPELERRGVAHVSHFGSQARGEDTEVSDIDIAVVLRPDARVSGYGFVGIELFLDEQLGRNVDLVEEPTERAYLQAEIERDRVRAY
jgi:predicted nucleotidyltransferase